MRHLSVVTSAYARAWRRGRLFVPLYLALRLLALALIAPGFAIVVNLAVMLSDQPALTDQGIAMFILSPVGFLAALALISILLVAEILGFAVMAASLRSGEANIWRAGRSAMTLVFARLPALLGFAVRFVLRVAILVVPFAVVAAGVAWWTLTEYDINYYLTFHPPAFWVAVSAIGAIVLILAWVLIRQLSAWALALHLVIFERLSPAEVFAESTRRMQGVRGRLKIELAIWLAVRAGIALAIGAVAGAVLALVPLEEGGSLRLALFVSLTVAALWSLAGLGLAAIALGALAGLLDGFYHGEAVAAPVAGTGNLRTRLVGLIAIAGIALGMGLWAGNRLLAQVQANDDVAVIAHRGAAGARPENTMASVIKAIEDRADWVEIDVQETADGEVVVAHDSDFMKLAGVPTKIWDITLADLAEIDIGSWFDPAYSQERTPTLRQVLDVAKDRAKVLIELKYYGHDVALEERVAEIVEAAGMTRQIATMSLKYPAVQKMRVLRPDWRTGVLAATSVGNLAALEGDFIAVNAAMASPGLIRSVHEAGKDFYVWTVNDPIQMSAMASLGVDGLITDEPALARRVLDTRAELGPAERLMLWLAGELGMQINRDGMRDESP